MLHSCKGWDWKSPGYDPYSTYRLAACPSDKGNLLCNFGISVGCIAERLPSTCKLELHCLTNLRMPSQLARRPPQAKHPKHAGAKSVPMRGGPLRVRIFPGFPVSGAWTKQNWCRSIFIYLIFCNLPPMDPWQHRNDDEPWLFSSSRNDLEYFGAHHDLLHFFRINSPQA